MEGIRIFKVKKMKTRFHCGGQLKYFLFDISLYPMLITPSQMPGIVYSQ